MSVAIDVVVPAYNVGAYIDEAIASALAQTLAPARVIVVDDASTDNTVARARRFGGRVTVLCQATNAGTAHARNRGAAQCSSGLLAFLDADDRWLPHKLAQQVAALADAPESAFALCGVRAFASPELPPAEQAALLAGSAGGEGVWLPSALLVRRAAWLRIGPFATDLAVAEGIDWFSRACPYGHVEVGDVGVERRLHRTNTTRLAAHDRSDYLRMALRHLQRRRGGVAP